MNMELDDLPRATVRRQNSSLPPGNAVPLTRWPRR